MVFNWFETKHRLLKSRTMICVVLVGINAFSQAMASTASFFQSQFDAFSGDYRLQFHNNLGIKIRYSSRSRYRGMFGWGWCSDLDAKLSKSASGSMSYIGCEVSGVDIVDPRVGAQQLLAAKNGTYERLSKEGDLQVFSQNGDLISLTRRDGEVIQIQRHPYEIVFVGFHIIKFELDSQYNRVSRIQIGQQRPVILHFDGIHLTSFGDENFQYDKYRRMIVRNVQLLGNSSLEKELIGYKLNGVGIQKFERRVASPDERLLVQMWVNEKSGKLEINAERGAEMYPVRIVYDVRRGTLDLIGDRTTARKLLSYLMS
jgi:hypothetical protein